MTTLSLFVALPILMGNLNPVHPKVQPFALSDVKLLASPWHTAMEADARYLLTVEPDRLLHSFRENVGLKAKAVIYEGWEHAGLAGHSLGHYLSACSQQFAASGDVRYKERVDYIVKELTECQAHIKDGYIAAMPDGDRVWNEVRKGEIHSGGFDLNGLWSPWYTHHKVLAGLLDAYRLTQNRDALKVAEKFADWAFDLTKNLTETQWQKMLGCEYGGMNDCLAELFHLTGQARYLELSRKFYDHAVLQPLAESRDELAGRHSNTQIPKLIGLARLYELTGDKTDRHTAEFFWDRVVNHHSYVIGGNSDHEYLGQPDKLNDSLSTNTCETCNTYNMLKLTRHLFCWDPKLEYADYMERAHLNDILASQDPATGMMCYFVPLASGAFRTHSNPFDDWTCCHGSGMENHTKHADSVYFHEGGKRLYVTQYIPTDLNWHQAGVQLTQVTNYPADGRVTITVNKSSGKHFEMEIRHPAWSEAFDISVNGKVVQQSLKPGFTSIARTWAPGDKVEFTIPLRLRTEAMPDNAKRVAVLYGPTVLAASLGAPEGPQPRIPVLVTNNKPLDQLLSPVAGQPLMFVSTSAPRPEPLTFRPFYQLHNERYAVYFDIFSDEQWHVAEAAYRSEESRVKSLEARTVDIIRVGEMQPERDHNLKEHRTDVREANGRGFRMPMGGGWFEFTMKVSPEKVNDLVLTYWGYNRYSRHFAILVDGVRVAEETLADSPNDVLFDRSYAIANTLTTGKASVVVRIESLEGKSGGSIAGARIVTAEK